MLKYFRNFINLYILFESICLHFFINLSKIKIFRFLISLNYSYLYLKEYSFLFSDSLSLIEQQDLSDSFHDFILALEDP